MTDHKQASPEEDAAPKEGAAPEDSQQTLDMFDECFPKLPPELRLMIWKEALPTQRIVPVLVNCYGCSYITFKSGSGFNPHAPWTPYPKDDFFRAMEVPAILTMNQESREVGKKHYEIMYTNDGLVNMKVHIDYSVDIPFFNLEHRDDFYVLPEKAKLQQLAMKMPKYWRDDLDEWTTCKRFKMKKGPLANRACHVVSWRNRLPTPNQLQLFVNLRTVYLVLGESIFEQSLKPGQEVRFIKPTVEDAEALGGLEEVEKIESRIAKKMKKYYPSPEQPLPEYKVVSCIIHTNFDVNEPVE